MRTTKFFDIEHGVADFDIKKNGKEGLPHFRLQPFHMACNLY